MPTAHDPEYAAFVHHAMVASADMAGEPPLELRVATNIGARYASSAHAWFTMDAGSLSMLTFLTPASCRALAAGLLQAAQHLDADQVAQRIAANLSVVAP